MIEESQGSALYFNKCTFGVISYLPSSFFRLGTLLVASSIQVPSAEYFSSKGFPTKTRSSSVESSASFANSPVTKQMKSCFVVSKKQLAVPDVIRKGIYALENMLTPLFDQVVGHVQDTELLHHMDSLQFVYEIVGDPQFLQGVCYGLLQDMTTSDECLSLNTHSHTQRWHSS